MVKTKVKKRGLKCLHHLMHYVLKTFIIRCIYL